MIEATAARLQYQSQKQIIAAKRSPNKPAHKNSLAQNSCESLASLCDFVRWAVGAARVTSHMKIIHESSRIHTNVAQELGGFSFRWCAARLARRGLAFVETI